MAMIVFLIYHRKSGLFEEVYQGKYNLGTSVPATSLDGQLVKICERLPADIHGLDLSIHEHPLGNGKSCAPKMLLIMPDIF